MDFGSVGDDSVGAAIHLSTTHLDAIRLAARKVCAQVYEDTRGQGADAPIRNQRNDGGEEGAKSKHTVDDYMTTWRNLGDTKGGRRR